MSQGFESLAGERVDTRYASNPALQSFLTIEKVPFKSLIGIKVDFNFTDRGLRAWLGGFNP